MPGRKQVQTACQRCRQRRAKCDGQQPCKRCKQSGDGCEYNRRVWTSKNDLRAELGRLKLNLETAEATQGPDQRSTATQNQISSAAQTSTSSQNALRRWIGETKSAHVDVSKTPPEADSMDCSSGSMPGRVSDVVSPVTTNTSLGAWSSFDQLLSWRSCHPTFQDRDKASLRTSVELFLPPAPIDTHGLLLQADEWTQTGWTRAHIRHLLDILITWIYTAFILLQKDEFLRDYEQGSTRFCSSALVHALLALSTRIINEKEDESDVLPSGWLGSRWFLLRTEALLCSQAPYSSLPDIQALGILSLYYIRCGREEEAIKLAETCSCSILLSIRQMSSIPKSGRLRIVAPCHYFGMSRGDPNAHRLSKVFNEAIGALPDDGSILDRPPYSHAEPEVATTDTNLNLHPASPQLLLVKILQLTEWVYTFIVANRRAPRSNQEQTISVYTKCLGWYRDVFELISKDGGRTPFLLFVHIYYHFCLFSAFRPLINTEFAISELRPHEICGQAVQSILSLAQSYDDLFTLRRVSALIPYFVCASGLFSLAIEDSGSHMDFVQMRPLAAVDAQTATLANSGAAPVTSDTPLPARIKVPAVAQARVLLARMGATHPAAALAEKKLAQSLTSWHRSRRPR